MPLSKKSELKYIKFKFEGTLPDNGKMEELKLTDSIKMMITSRLYPNNILYPWVKFEFNQSEGTRMRLRIFLAGREYFQDFKKLNETLEIVITRNPYTKPSTPYNGTQPVTVEVTLAMSPIAEIAAKDFASLLDNQNFSDFKIIVGTKHIHVHKAILVASSPVFMTMFTGDFRESKDDQGTFASISYDAMFEFLRYLYTNRVTNLETHVVELLQISYEYLVDGLQSMCEVELLKGLTEANSADIFQYAHRYGCGNGLKEATFKLIKNSFSRHNYDVPDEYIKKPGEVKQLIIVRDQMEKLLENKSNIKMRSSPKK